MTSAALQAKATEIEAAIAALKLQPHLTGCWLDCSTNRKGSTYTRLVWTVPGERYANGKPKKRRRTLKSPDEVADYRGRIERGKRILALEKERQELQSRLDRMAAMYYEIFG